MEERNEMQESVNQVKHVATPSVAYTGAAWAVLIIGVGAYLIGLSNAEMQLNEQGYYLTVLLYGLFSAIAVQKSVRDKEEGLPVTSVFYGISWFSIIAAIALLVIGLWNADLALSEKGFYGLSFTMSLFAVVCVQKNIRDYAISKK